MKRLARPGSLGSLHPACPTQHSLLSEVFRAVQGAEPVESIQTAEFVWATLSRTLGIIAMLLPNGMTSLGFAWPFQIRK